MSVEGLLGTDDVFAADLQALRPHPGQAASAANLRTLLAGSADHGRATADRSAPASRTPTRCAAAPQVAGGVRDTVDHAATVAGRELASAVDNPVVTPGRAGRVQRQLPRRAGRLRAGLPRHRRRRPGRDRPSGAPTGSWTSRATTACTPFLADDPGVDSGHMIAQYTQAAIVSEMKRLAVPAIGRLDPELGDAGGPRLDGLVAAPASCAAPSTG